MNPVPRTDPRTTPVHGRWMTGSDRFALFAIAVLVVISTSVAFVESYDGLLKWAQAHHLQGWRADAWPLQVDAFIAIGEAALFVAIIRRWDVKGRIFAWTVTLSGAAVSIAANIGHVGGNQDLTVYATAGIPPVAACGGLTIALQILKRTVRDLHHDDHAVTVSASERSMSTSPPISWKIVNGKIGWSVDLSLNSAQRTSDKINSVPSPEALPALKTPEHADDAQYDDIYKHVQETEKKALEGHHTYAAKHSRWNEGVRIYTESVKTGNPLSQRKLAEALGMKNRSVATAIISHVKDGGRINNVSI